MFSVLITVLLSVIIMASFLVVGFVITKQNEETNYLS